jgi:hypothetical protein
MTNDKIPKNAEARMSNFGFRHSAFFRHLSFVIRHFSDACPL